MSAPQTPIFPLNIPLFPDCQMPLQIFEPRYLDMIPRCMKTGAGFVVALLRPGTEHQEVLQRKEKLRPETESPQAPRYDIPCYDIPFNNIGTLANVIDFGQRENGLLAITIQGGQRQRLTNIERQQDGLWIGCAEPLAETSVEQTYELAAMVPLLKRLLILSGLNEIESTIDYASSQQVINYLIMLLPFDNGTKQSLLEIDDQSLRMQMAIEKINALEIKGEEESC